MMEIGFSRSLKTPLFSKLIMYFSQAKFSHCYIKLNDMIYHSNMNGVNIDFYDVFLKSNYVYDEIQINLKDEEEELVYDKIKELLHKKYSKKNLIGMMLQIVFKLKTNIFKDQERRLTCSEFVYLVLRELGFTLKKDIETITPKDIYNGLLLWKNR